MFKDEPKQQNDMAEMKLAERLLRKVKLNNNGGLTIEWLDMLYNPETFARNEVSGSRTSDALAHDDMIAAMGKLKEHLIILGEEETVKGNYPFDGSVRNLEKYFVSSLTLRGGLSPGEGEDATPVSAHIFGRKKLTTGHVKNFGVAAKLGVPQEQYKFNGQLAEHVEAIIDEAWAYLFDGKHNDPPASNQKSMDFPEDDGRADEAIANIGGSTREEAMEAANTTALGDAEEAEEVEE